MSHKARLIAFFLPQYHPIPENDEWHGSGFTEWTNVTRAKPLFRGHYQPILPADLGFYDLRVPEVREQQAALARKYGVEAFCYWHYWFGNGRRILDRPVEELIESGKPDFPFCLAWANESWTGIWYGMEDHMLLSQEYPGVDDFRDHFYAMLPAFSDPRYLTVRDKKVFLVHGPQHIQPDHRIFTNLWQELANKEGLGGFHFIEATYCDQSPVGKGFAGSVQVDPYLCLPVPIFWKIKHHILNRVPFKLNGKPQRNHYRELVQYLGKKQLRVNEYPLVMPNWDNTARCGSNGSVLVGSSPVLFEKMLKDAIQKASRIYDPENRLVFVESWNEWAEGNILEPDQRYGKAYLECIQRVNRC